MSVVIVDYNMGNLRSVQNAFEKIGVKATIQRDPERFHAYDRMVLPGVGAFGDAMEHLRSTGADQAIREFAASGKPLLGICLGMQLLFERSLEFGEHRGLGLIPGEVVPFDRSRFLQPHKVPHMGWNKLFVQGPSPLFAGMADQFYLYFVHSYHAKTQDCYAIGKTVYGYDFVSAVARENVFGLQPHPEKSHDNGLQILQNFMEL
ncbi:MAG: imidazole glycerol phosphate synthase subunit HisH [Nitratiruptor sp.]|nr:imidazole glycerol phosphate synthase subunit HisH [Nitratiruptor sp.]NPA83155.1 imidazole glycerol phosphate synthase subunit HisH [Campylobacterota bacterium]